jgi:hypothetical protein
VQDDLALMLSTRVIVVSSGETSTVSVRIYLRLVGVLCRNVVRVGIELGVGEGIPGSLVQLFSGVLSRR